MEQNLTRAVDREIHQDHYHTSVQPITQEEHSEEQNHNVVQEVEEQNFEYGDPEDTSRRLAELDAEYQNSREEVIAESTTTELPTIEGLHIHHHVHERIQVLSSISLSWKCHSCDADFCAACHRQADI